MGHICESESLGLSRVIAAVTWLLVQQQNVLAYPLPLQLKRHYSQWQLHHENHTFILTLGSVLGSLSWGCIAETNVSLKYRNIAAVQEEVSKGFIVLIWYYSP